MKGVTCRGQRKDRDDERRDISKVSESDHQHHAEIALTLIASLVGLVHHLVVISDSSLGDQPQSDSSPSDHALVSHNLVVIPDQTHPLITKSSPSEHYPALVSTQNI
ncbi:hypothetical protein QYF36_026707 [Acer negundo]|nr:hypothetical protein QYF36_026707 [Acer negundo]